MAHFRVADIMGPVVCMQGLVPGINVQTADGNSGVADMSAVLKNRRR